MKEVFEALRERFDAQVDRFREGGALKELHDLKYRHCFRVSREAEGIASDLGWEADRVACARGLGLLHDLGRFEQYARHGTFNDRVSVDHGDLGETLVREHFVDLLPQTWLRVIPPAIRWHNKRRLPADLDPESLAAGLRRAAGPEVEWETLSCGHGVDTDPAHPWVQRALGLLALEAGRVPEPGRLPYFTDAGVLAPALGRPPVLILGPGDPGQAHQTDESCPESAIRLAARFYAALCRDWMEQGR